MTQSSTPNILLILFSSVLAAALANPAPFRPPTALRVESLTTAEGVDTISPRFSWSLEPLIPRARGLMQGAYEVCLSLTTISGALGPYYWCSDRVYSGNTSLVVPAGIPMLPPSTRFYWTVRSWGLVQTDDPTLFSVPAVFTTGLPQTAWDGPWVCGDRGAENVFRGTFQLPVPPTSVSYVLAHVAGLGAHAVSFNGKPAGGNALRKLDGGWTKFARRVLYTTHDVTAALSPDGAGAENVIGVSLGNSWYNDAGWYKQPPYGWPSAQNGGGFSYESPPLLRVQIVVMLLNGTELRLSTMSGMVWLAARGPVTFDSLYDGETFDGRRAADIVGWDAPGFSPFVADWRPVVAAANLTINPALNARLDAQLYEPLQRLSSAPPLTMWSPEPGTTVYDFGSNGVGVVRWTFRGLPAESNVTMRYAEVMMHPPYGPSNGSLYFDNLRNARATDYYYADGTEDVEVYEPSFTWHGFRYAQVTGMPAPPALNDVAVVRQANAAAPGAAVAFAAPLLGVLQAMATNTMLGALQAGPGSCGQRDERQFFTGDTQVAAEALLQNFRTRALLASWLLGVLDDQNADGSVGFYLPTPVGDTRDGSPQWSTGVMTVAWLLLRLEGDVATCKTVYPSLVRYVAFNEVKYQAAITQCGSLACYWPEWPSEWQQVGPDPDPSAVNAFAYIRDLQMAAAVAEGVGAVSDAASFQARAASRLIEYHASFFKSATSSYGTGSQTELALALALGAPPTSEIVVAVLSTLLQSVIAAGMKQTAGIVGQRFLYEVLAAYGRADVGVRIFLDDTFPSFGFMAQGAGNPEPSSTVWEIWSAWNGDAIMSSRNHLMFSSYSTFLLRLAVGVEPRGNGYSDGALVWPVGFGLANDTQHLLPWSSGSMTTPRGTVDVSWTTIAPPVPSADQTCGKADEADAGSMAYVTLSCAEYNSTIAAIVFASFGHPSGSCSGIPFAVNESCHAVNSSDIVTAACIGRADCSVPVDNKLFGDPCSGQKKWLAINVSCSGTPPPQPRAYWRFLGTLRVTVPVNLPSVVRVPTFGLAAVAIVITEGAEKSSDPLVFVDGAYVEGVVGVTGANITQMSGQSNAVVDITIGSGSYSFTLWAANATLAS